MEAIIIAIINKIIIKK